MDTRKGILWNLWWAIAYYGPYQINWWWKDNIQKANVPLKVWLKKKWRELK